MRFDLVHRRPFQLKERVRRPRVDRLTLNGPAFVPAVAPRLLTVRRNGPTFFDLRNDHPMLVFYDQ